MGRSASRNALEKRNSPLCLLIIESKCLVFAPVNSITIPTDIRGIPDDDDDDDDDDDNNNKHGR